MTSDKYDEFDPSTFCDEELGSGDMEETTYELESGAASALFAGEDMHRGGLPIYIDREAVEAPPPSSLTFRTVRI